MVWNTFFVVLSEKNYRRIASQNKILHFILGVVEVSDHKVFHLLSVLGKLLPNWSNNFAVFATRSVVVNEDVFGAVFYNFVVIGTNKFENWALCFGLRFRNEVWL